VCTIYSETCLKGNVGLTTNCLQQKKIYSPDDLESRRSVLKVPALKATFLQIKKKAPLQLHYRQVSLHIMQVDCDTAAFASEVNPASPNRHSKYYLLSEERVLVVCNFAQSTPPPPRARGLQSVRWMYKRVPVC